MRLVLLALLRARARALKQQQHRRSSVIVELHLLKQAQRPALRSLRQLKI